MTKKVDVLYSFSLGEFLLEGFSHEVFNEAIRAMQLAYAMYSFLQYRFFPLGFRMEFLTRHMHLAVFAQGGVLGK